MKSLLVSVILVATAYAHAGTVELGQYKAVDAETQSIVASFNLKADSTLTFTVSSTDGSIPQTNCTGKYTVKGNTFAANLTCQSQLLPTAAVNIDVTNVTPEGLRSAKGVSVAVKIDALGADATEFILKKNDPKP
jgi:hypothetical protein